MNCNSQSLDAQAAFFGNPTQLPLITTTFTPSQLVNHLRSFHTLKPTNRPKDCSKRERERESKPNDTLFQIHDDTTLIPLAVLHNHGDNNQFR
jgi:hypothetical protein